LSITHHTRKRPCTDPQITHGLHTSTSRRDLEQNQTSPIYLLERKPTHTDSSCLPQLGRTTSHPEIAHKLGQQGPY
jgi:hypothetical protein